MREDSPPTSVKLQVSAECPGGPLCHISVRDHAPFSVDEPPDFGGQDSAPRPLEYLLGSLIACSNVVGRALAQKLKIPLEDYRVELDALLDPSGFYRKREDWIPFSDVTLTIRARTTATPAQLEKLREALAHHCPVQVILRRAGTRITEKWETTG